MDVESLNRISVGIVEKKMELGRLNYVDKDYDDLEEELHALEDELLINFGKDLEQIIKTIHLQYCPHTEPHSPIAYFAQRYIKIGKYENGTAIYDIANLQQGLLVEYNQDESAYLVILPNPMRFVLVSPQDDLLQTVWTTEDAQHAS